MPNVYILAPCRTAIGSFMGSLSAIPAHALGGHVIAEVIRQAGISPSDIDQVVMGNALQAGQGQNPARQAAVHARVPIEVPASTVNKVCGSGLYSVYLAAALIRAGDAECVIAGGMENMSAVPRYLSDSRTGKKMGDIPCADGMLADGLTDAFGKYHMGVTAENLAVKYNITRQEQDAFAFWSQQKAMKASREKIFEKEIIDLDLKMDEYIRYDTGMEKLGRLKPSFKQDGTVTPGNSSGINDGAAAMAVVSERYIKRTGIRPFARYLCGASCGVDPALMGLGPVPSINKALCISGLSLSDIDLFELNEAFAAQSIAVLRELPIPFEKVNVNGGAIALGHPIGASGARITVSLLHEMVRSHARYGLAALCVGGGMGEAAVFEVV